MVTLLVTVVVLGVLIFVHELGHFLVAKRAGVRVHEFALGFGPRVAAVRRGETAYTLRALPLGGFVRMAGVHPQEEDLATVPAERRFMHKGVLPRMGIIAAGPAANVLLAAALFTLLFAAVGATSPTLVIDALEPGYPAADAGFRPGDRIVAIDGRRVRTWEQLVISVSGSAGEQLQVSVRRDGETRTVSVRPVREGSRGVIGIRPVTERRRYALPQAVVEGFRWTGRVVVSFFAALGGLLQGQMAGEILGPVGIGAEIGEATQTGLPNLLFLAALLSANLALINLLPIPALDGSRLVFLVVEGLRGRPVDPEKEGLIHLLGFALMLALLVFVSIRDVLRIFGGV